MLKGLIARLRRRRQDAPPELRGRPQIRREKAYAADSGYVYQYTYEGFRDAEREAGEGREFVFECTSDRRSRFLVTVFAPAGSFETWESESGRELSEVERYAVVKMQLFAIFDRSEHIVADRDERLSPEDIREQVEALDL